MFSQLPCVGARYHVTESRRDVRTFLALTLEIQKMNWKMTRALSRGGWSCKQLRRDAIHQSSRPGLGQCGVQLEALVYIDGDALPSMKAGLV